MDGEDVMAAAVDIMTLHCRFGYAEMARISATAKVRDIKIKPTEDLYCEICYKFKIKYQISRIPQA